jgi:ketosteroid isomerase-like protein
MAQSDAEILQSGYDAFAQGDVPGVLALFAEDIAWHVPGDNLVAGSYSGHQEVVGFFQKLGELSGGTFNVSVREIFDNGTGTVVALVTLAGERNGRQQSNDTVQVWRFVDGMAVSFNEFNDAQAELDEFWS